MKDFIFWVGSTSSDHSILRTLKIRMMQALVVGMGLEWPDGGYDSIHDSYLTFEIIVPMDRVWEFVGNINGKCGPDLCLEDIGCVDYPVGDGDRIADELEHDYKMTVGPILG